MSEFRQEFLDQTIGNGEYQGTVAEAIEQCPVFKNLGAAAVETLVETYSVLSDTDEEGNIKSEEEQAEAETTLLTELLALKAAKDSKPTASLAATKDVEATFALSVAEIQNESPIIMQPNSRGAVVHPSEQLASQHFTHVQSVSIEASAHSPLQNFHENLALSEELQELSINSNNTAISSTAEVHVSDMEVLDATLMANSFMLSTNESMSTETTEEELNYQTDSTSFNEAFEQHLPITAYNEVELMGEGFEISSLFDPSGTTEEELPSITDQEIAAILQSGSNDMETPWTFEAAEVRESVNSGEPSTENTLVELFTEQMHQELTQSLATHAPELEQYSSEIVTAITECMTQEHTQEISKAGNEIALTEKLIDALMEQQALRPLIEGIDSKQLHIIVQQLILDVLNRQHELSLSLKNQQGTHEHLLAQAKHLLQIGDEQLHAVIGRFALLTAAA